MKHARNAERVKATPERVKNADYTNPHKLRVMLNTTLAETPTPVRCWQIAKRTILITFPQEAKRWLALLALGDGQNSNDYWT